MYITAEQHAALPRPDLGTVRKMQALLQQFLKRSLMGFSHLVGQVMGALSRTTSPSLSAQQPRGTSGWKNGAHVQISSAALRNVVCNTIYRPHLICVNLRDVGCKTSRSKSNFYLILDSFLPSVANGVMRGDRHNFLLQRMRAAWLCISPQHNWLTWEKYGSCGMDLSGRWGRRTV